MAEFSKEWCERNDPHNPGDFDIMKEFEKLDPNHYINLICEGFGFLAIAKNIENECLLGMPIDGEPHGTVMWKKYEEIVK